MSEDNFHIRSMNLVDYEAAFALWKVARFLLRTSDSEKRIAKALIWVLDSHENERAF